MSSAPGEPSSLAEFSPSRRFLACVVGGSTVKVWDTSRGGVLRNQFRLRDHLSTDLTCLAFATTAPAAPASEGTSDDKGQDNAKTHTSVEQDSMVALGTSAGDVLLWSITTGDVLLELKKVDSLVRGHVRHLALNSAQTRLFACSSKSPAVVEYNLQNGARVRALDAKKDSSLSVPVSATGGFERLALSADGTRLLCASSKVFLWDLQAGSLVAAFLGHASPVRALGFLPSGRHFYSADSDSFINIWSARGNTGSGSSSKNVKTHHKAKIRLIASGDVRAVHAQSVGGRSGKTNTALIYCLCDSGDIDVWKVNAKKHKNAAPQQAHALIACDGEDSQRNQTDSDDSFGKVAGAEQGGGIFAVSSTTSSSSGSVLCARGSMLRPHFETVNVLGGEDSQSLVSRTLEFLDTAALLKSLRKAANGKDDVADAIVASSSALHRQAHVHSARDSAAAVARPKRKLPSIQHEIDGASGEIADNSPKKKIDLQTLEERLNSLQRFTADGNAGENDDDDANTAVNFGESSRSLVTILQQALQANDRAKLEYCLSVQDKEIVTTTINKLPAVCVLPFLRQLVDRLEKSPRRGRILVNWIRKILLRHTAYLMTVPDLARELAALYEIIASRSSLYTKFCRLSGRVDVLLAQLTHRQSLQLAAKQKPVVFRDGSDDEDIDGGRLEEEDDSDGSSLDNRESDSEEGADEADCDEESCN